MLNSPDPSDRGRDKRSTDTGADAGDSLLTDVDFKWLMAGQGWWIDTTRLHCDAAYAAGLLTLALESPLPALRECAAELEAQIGVLATSRDRP